MAGKGHYPAVDLLNSISRLMPDIVSREQREAATVVRELIAVHHEHEDLISIGAYRKGSHPLVDAAIADETGNRSFPAAGRGGIGRPGSRRRRNSSNWPPVAARR